MLQSSNDLIRLSPVTVNDVHRPGLFQQPVRQKTRYDKIIARFTVLRDSCFPFKTRLEWLPGGIGVLTFSSPSPDKITGTILGHSDAVEREQGVCTGTGKSLAVE